MHTRLFKTISEISLLNLGAGVFIGFLAGQSDQVAVTANNSPYVSNSIVELLHCILTCGSYLTAPDNEDVPYDETNRMEILDAKHPRNEKRLNCAFSAEIGFWVGWGLGVNVPNLFSHPYSTPKFSRP